MELRCTVSHYDRSSLWERFKTLQDETFLPQNARWWRLSIELQCRPTSSFSTFSLAARSLLLALSCETVSSSRALVCSLSSKSRCSFLFVCDNISMSLSSCCRLITHAATDTQSVCIIDSTDV